MSKGKVAKLPKTKCCVSKTRCQRCPIRMLKEGTLPSGYGVHKRRLVKITDAGLEPVKKSKKSGKSKKSKKKAAAKKAA